MIAKCAKSHTVADNLILPAAKTIVTTMIGDESENDLNLIALSNDTGQNHRLV